MTRWKLTLEYDGGPFVGWQKQENGMSVQQALSEALAIFCGDATNLTAAGRTDAGVHARGQVVHFDTARDRSVKDVRDGLNFHLRPHPISVLDAEVVPDDFSARRSAIERQYLYIINNRRPSLALELGRAWHIPHLLDAAAMHNTAQLLVGHHDFTSFRAVECQSKSPVKTLDELNVWREGDQVFMFARARSFLHHQIRNIIGTLSLVGHNRWSKQDVQDALDAKDRGKAGPTAPPEGLYFMKVVY